MKLPTPAFFKLLILLALCPLSLCAIVEPPRDTASLEGSKDVQLNCSVSQGSTIKWEAVFEWKITSHPIYPGVAANQNFTVAQDGSSISINTLSKSLTGIYICSEGAYSAEARVAAMQPLSCNQPGEMMTVTVGDPVVLNCSTSYEAYVKTPLNPLRPTLALVKGDGTVVAKIRAEKPGPLSISDNVTATEEMDGSRMVCRLYFEEEEAGSRSSVKVLPPLYEDSCTYNLNVNHGVSWAKIVTNLNESSNIVHVGQTITCEANGRPRPSFEWMDGNDTVISTGDNLTMTMSMVKPQATTFTCVAKNTLPGPNSQGVVHTAKASIELIVSTPKPDEVQQGVLAPWAIALIVVIPLVVIILVAILLIVMCLKRRSHAKNKPYKPASKKPDQSYKNLIYTPTAQVPNTGPGMAFMNSNQTKSPPPRADYTSSPFTRNDNSDDFNGHRNFKANVGHGDLGMSGLSGSRGADLNMGSKGNLQEAGRQQQDRSLSPRPPLHPYGGSSEGLNFPPLPPRQADPNRYHDNHDGSGQKRGRQNHDKVKSPPPPASYLDPGFGRQASITSTSTNRSGSSEGSRVAGRAVEKNPAGRQQKTGKRVTSPSNQGQGHADGARRQGKKPVNNRQADTGHPPDVHSLQGSEV